jgi:hypothetical protein
MPSNWIVRLNFEYPAPGAYNLRELDKAIFNRYYSSYFARVESSGFTHPNDDLYLRNFDNPLPASFVHSDRVGLTLNPGNDRRWLVFVHSDGRLVSLLARYVVVVDGVVQLFGESAHGIQYKPEDDVTLSGVVVPSNTAGLLNAGGVGLL